MLLWNDLFQSIIISVKNCKNIHYQFKYGVLFKEMNTFIQQGRIKLIKRDSKDIYNVIKDFYFK